MRVAALAALVALSSLLRTRGLDAGYWIDEGISVGISDRPLGAVLDALRWDGAPPLYPLLLWAWMAAGGTGESWTHALSLVFALSAVPAAWWAARAWSDAAAWWAAALVAVNPFLTVYAQETRSYALLALVSLLAAGAWLRAGDARWRVALGALLGAACLTHHWGWYLVAALAVATVVAPPSARLRDALPVAGALALVYAPALPLTVAQLAETGAPWSIVPGPQHLLDVVVVLLGGSVAALGLAALARWADRRASALAAGAAAGAAIAWLVAQVEPNWAGRYLAAFLGPVLLCVAAAAARAPRPLWALAAAVCFAWALDSAPERKSNVREIAAGLAPALRAGDLVVVAHPEQAPVAAHYLPPGLRWASTLGPLADPRRMDWRDATARLERADPARTLAALRAGNRRVLLVAPLPFRSENRRSPWLRLVARRAAEWRVLLDAQSRVVRALPDDPEAAPRRGVQASLRVLRPEP